MNNYFIHQENSQTIRLMPENYCVLIFHNNRWLVDCDHAVEIELLHKVIDITREVNCIGKNSWKILLTVLNRELSKTQHEFKFNQIQIDVLKAILRNVSGSPSDSYRKVVIEVLKELNEVHSMPLDIERIFNSMTDESEMHFNDI